jgi:multicomponent Na+:H+ antiporter subunit D
MTIESSVLPLLACLASLAAVPAIVALRKSPNAREGATLVAAAVKFALVLAMLPAVLGGSILEFTFVEVFPGVPLQFRVDGLGMLFALVASSLWMVTTVYSIGYMRGLDEHGQTRFFAFFAVSLSATLGVAFAGNLFTLYVFYELLSLATFPLVTHHQDKEARTGGRTYLSHLLGTSIAFVLPAMSYAFWKSGGTMDFSSGGFLAGKVGGGEALIMLLAFVFGFAKAGVMPFHSWLPGAMVAPTPVSALLHAVAVVKVGVFCIIRVFTGVFGTEFLATLGVACVIQWIAAFTIVVSSLIALTQDNLKRRLAFSTIGQLSYIVLGAALLSENAEIGAMMHISTHAFGKITLFFCAGAIYVATGKKYVSQLDGIGRKMPWTMTAFLLGSISIIGLPPFYGAWSKWYLLLGTMDAKAYWMTAALLVSSLLNIAYLIPITVRAFFKPPQDDAGAVAEAPLACVIPLCLTAGLCFVFFLFPGVFKALAQLVAASPSP